MTSQSGYFEENEKSLEKRTLHGWVQKDLAGSLSNAVEQEVVDPIKNFAHDVEWLMSGGKTKPAERTVGKKKEEPKDLIGQITDFGTHGSVAAVTYSIAGALGQAASRRFGAAFKLGGTAMKVLDNRFTGNVLGAGVHDFYLNAQDMQGRVANAVGGATTMAVFDGGNHLLPGKYRFTKAAAQPVLGAGSAVAGYYATSAVEGREVKESDLWRASGEGAAFGTVFPIATWGLGKFAGRIKARTGESFRDTRAEVSGFKAGKTAAAEIGSLLKGQVEYVANEAGVKLTEPTSAGTAANLKSLTNTLKGKIQTEGICADISGNKFLSTNVELQKSVSKRGAEFKSSQTEPAKAEKNTVEGKKSEGKEFESAESKQGQAKELQLKKAEAKEVEVRETETKKAEAKEVEVKEAETKKAEAKDVEVKEAETKKAETKEVEVKETETKKAETKEVEVKEAETKKAETKDVEVKETETRVGEHDQAVVDATAMEQAAQAEVATQAVAEGVCANVSDTQSIAQKSTPVEAVSTQSLEDRVDVALEGLSDGAVANAAVANAAVANAAVANADVAKSNAGLSTAGSSSSTGQVGDALTGRNVSSSAEIPFADKVAAFESKFGSKSEIKTGMSKYGIPTGVSGKFTCYAIPFSPAAGSIVAAHSAAQQTANSDDHSIEAAFTPFEEMQLEKFRKQLPDWMDELGFRVALYSPPTQSSETLHSPVQFDFRRPRFAPVEQTTTKFTRIVAPSFSQILKATEMGHGLRGPHQGIPSILGGFDSDTRVQYEDAMGKLPDLFSATKSMYGNSDDLRREVYLRRFPFLTQDSRRQSAMSYSIENSENANVGLLGSGGSSNDPSMSSMPISSVLSAAASQVTIPASQQ